MGQGLAKGDYVAYPCVNGCGHHMQVKDEVQQLEQTAGVNLECSNCDAEKEYSVAELNGIVRSGRY